MWDLRGVSTTPAEGERFPETVRACPALQVRDDAFDEAGDVFGRCGGGGDDFFV